MIRMDRSKSGPPPVPPYAAGLFLVTWFVARTQVRIAVDASMGVCSGAGQTNRHSIMQNQAHAFRLLGRLGRVGTIGGSRQRAGRILIGAQGIKGHPRESQESKQSALRC